MCDFNVPVANCSQGTFFGMCGPVWPSGKALGIRQMLVQFPTLVLQSLQTLWFMDSLVTLSLKINETLNGSHCGPS